MSQRKVMVIGLDAATLDLVRPWADEGRLPHLARFFEGGVAASLLSTVPAMSPAAWSTIATGLNPGKHGVLDFFQFGADSYRPRLMNASQRRGATFWEIAGQQGVRGGVINMPVTYPPRPYNGFLIGCMLSPSVNRKMATPPEVFDDLIAFSPNYALDMDMLGGERVAPEEFCERVLVRCEARLKAALGLYGKYRPPLFCCVFVAADRIGHYFWPYHECLLRGLARTEKEVRLGSAIRRVYELLDRAVGELVEAAGGDTDVMIVSDHGAGPLRRGLNLFQVLVDSGLAVRRHTSLARRLSRRAVMAFARAAPQRLKGTVKALLPGASGRAAGIVAAAGVDFARSKAYPAGQADGVFVNVRGRQPSGMVEPGREYERVREELIRTLLELTDPQTGQKVFSRCRRREEVWSGPLLEQLPDVVFEQRDRVYHMPTFSENRPDQAFYELPKPDPNRLWLLGTHRPDGIIMAMGPHIRKAEIQGAGVADVPATVLTLLGCDLPEDYDGRPLMEILTDDVKPPRKAAPVEAAGTGGEQFNATDAQAVQERLKGLGYM